MAAEREQGRLTVSAIVPAFNEEDRIAGVLDSLRSVELIDEIIVVDDGSADRTAEIVSRFEDVRLLRLPANQGKGRALDAGVKACAGSVLFFCDADLDGLEPAVVREIIEPVLRGEYAMFVGARAFRENPISRGFVHLEAKWGIYPTTGQRALRLGLWELLPERYKEGYRTEVGLNFIARRSPGGLGFKRFSYGHAKKEKKLGLRRGLAVKFRMYGQVLASSFRVRFIDR